MWEERADRARRDIAALAAEGLGVSDLHTAAIAVINARVSTDLTCWATIDPETLAISTITNGETQIPQEYEPRLAESEYAADEPHRFATLARRKEPMARLSDMSERDRNRSARFNNPLAALGGRSGASRHVHRRRSLLGRCWHGADRSGLHCPRNGLPRRGGAGHSQSDPPGRAHGSA